MLKKRKFIIGAVIIVLALGFLGYRGFVASAVYYYKVSEFVGQQVAFSEKNVRVSGTVTDGTIEKQGTTVRFTISDGLNNLRVVYTGVIPDSFKAEAEAVVEGKLNSAGVFEAVTLLAKCPSKYEPVSEQKTVQMQ